MSKWAAVWLVVAMVPALALSQDRPAKDASPGYETIKVAPIAVVAENSKADLVRQTFPARASEDKFKTAWEIDWDFVPSMNGRVKLLRTDNLDPDAMRRLASLGYVGATAAPIVRKDAPRPADMMPVLATTFRTA